jgi:hypothetical protein
MFVFCTKIGLNVKQSVQICDLTNLQFQIELCARSLLATCSNMFCVQLWCNADEEFSADYDSHSPPRDRVMKPLSNMKEFSDVWGCTADSPMNPRDKCVLW